MKKYKIINMPPNDFNYDELSKKLMKLFREEIYEKLVFTDDEIFVNADNANKTALYSAVSKGQVKFWRGRFHGKFNSSISKELRSLGAVYDRREKNYKLLFKDVPKNLKAEILVSESKLKSKFNKINAKLNSINPKEISEKINATSFFDKIVDLNNGTIEKKLDKITVSTKLTKLEKSRFSAEYTNTLEKHIKGFVEKEVVELREIVERHNARGLRAESLVNRIRNKYQISQDRALFIARQETRMAAVKFREARFVDAGSEGYFWTNVLGAPSHPVRPLHKKLNGKFFKWSDPPITTLGGKKNHPGEDYNCRCRAKAVIKI